MYPNRTFPPLILPFFIIPHSLLELIFPPSYTLILWSNIKMSFTCALNSSASSSLLPWAPPSEQTLKSHCSPTPCLNIPSWMWLAKMNPDHAGCFISMETGKPNEVFHAGRWAYYISLHLCHLLLFSRSLSSWLLKFPSPSLPALCAHSMASDLAEPSAKVS